MAKKKRNKMATHAVEATGLRMIGMYVQEFFRWGWQPYGQENDDGIDGEIIPRFKNGEDMGVRIKVQSKSGPSYVSSMNEDTVNIQPYSSKERLIKHINSWNRSNEPVILVYTNAEKERNGNKYLDLKNPKVWWIRMDDYTHDDTSLIKIPRRNLFQEHIKGELLKILKPYIKEWINNPKIKPDRNDLKIWNSLNILEDAKNFYKEWKLSNPKITINDKSYELKVSRTGWRHITNKSRKERVHLSLKLLPIARKILERTDIRPIMLRSKEMHTRWNSRTDHIGFRARVEIEGHERKVQVVLKRYRNIEYKKEEKIWFYSVHIVK